MRILTAIVALLLGACGGTDAVRVYVAEDGVELRRVVAERLETRIGGRVVERAEDADWVVETAVAS